MSREDPRTPDEWGVPRWWLWAGLAVPPGAWALHGFVGVWITTQACEAGNAAAARWATFVLTLVLLAASVAGGVLGLLSWRRLHGRAGVADAEARGRPEFMALGGLLFGVVFTLGILWAGLSTVLLQDPCGQVR